MFDENDLKFNEIYDLEQSGINDENQETLLDGKPRKSFGRIYAYQNF